MTFRCALRFEPDKAKGPGYGLILASCPGFSAAPNTLLYMIKDPSNGMSLGPNGWQPGDALNIFRIKYGLIIDAESIHLHPEFKGIFCNTFIPLFLFISTWMIFPVHHWHRLN